MGRVIRLDFKLDDMCIAVIVQLYIAVDQRIGNATPIVKGDNVLPFFSHEFEIFLVVEDTVAVDAALED